MFTKFDKAFRKLPDSFEATILRLRASLKSGECDEHEMCTRKYDQVALLSTVRSN